jgi:hypothetical protein
VLVMRQFEALVAIGVFKDLQGMNDRELFIEYDKMVKKSRDSLSNIL